VKTQAGNLEQNLKCYQKVGEINPNNETTKQNVEFLKNKFEG